MPWFDRLFASSPAQSPPEQEQSAKKIAEQINPTMLAMGAPTQEDYYWGRLTSGTEEDYYFRRLTDNFYQKDLMPSTYLEMHNLIYESWNANPLARAIIEITTSFVLGKGVTIAANHKRVQQLLMQFWDDSDNQMAERVYLLCNELALYGEIFVRFFVNKYDGSVKIRMIDPSLIDLIETDPEDIETPLRFHRRPVGQTIAVTDPPQNPPDLTKLDTSSTNTQGEWFLAREEVMQFTINKVSNAKRGASDLATILPWLRRYKDWLTDRVRINKYKGAFLWDITLQGADLKTIQRKRMEYGYPPEPGSVVIHNETEQWKAVQPQINANEAYEDGRAIKLMVAVGALIPEHFLSDGTTTNRATAAEMGLPTLLKFQRRQRVMGTVLRCILDRVILEAQKAGKLGKSIDTRYELIFPQIDVDDNQSLGMGVQYVTAGLATAKSQGWISDETAMRLLFKFANEEVDVHEELARIAGQQERRADATSVLPVEQAELSVPVPPVKARATRPQKREEV
ncbi:hypothetical protein EPA93_09190 [Ktedonosporobacter rubrisoli]|uniref:Phage portal protein n=1 Tax=Ktedonosporobacter rubrisoli TaxID=2509675 RepID=A0A4P6JM46_KTERU|nr:hypothetical protein [Ktedonosporobacter rubrisoli]QBD76173.1 hypothetical protein EPA93_09190 [Ktedonosporobacter rubrisoli]